MLTINKMTRALNGILSCANNTHTTPQANLGVIWVIANETLKEVAPEIEQIKAEDGGL